MKIKPILLGLIAAGLGVAIVTPHANARPSALTIGAAYSQKNQERHLESSRDAQIRATQKTIALAVGEQDNPAPPPYQIRKRGGQVHTFSYTRERSEVSLRGLLPFLD